MRDYSVSDSFQIKASLTRQLVPSTRAFCLFLSICLVCFFTFFPSSSITLIKTRKWIFQVVHILSHAFRGFKMKKKCLKLFCLSICCFYGEKNSRFRAKLKKKQLQTSPLFLLFFLSSSFSPSQCILRILIIWISLIITRILLGMFRGSIVNLLRIFFSFFVIKNNCIWSVFFSRAIYFTFFLIHVCKIALVHNWLMFIF